MEIITNDLPQHGVLIHGPKSPGFRSRLFALVTVPPELEDDALRYSILIENQTPKHILQIKLVWRPYPQKGWPLPFYEGAGVSIDPVFNDVSRSLIKPGEQCPWSILKGHGFWWQKAVIAPTDVHPEEIREALLAASPKWSVDVDGALFDDGVFAGPDTDLWFDQYEARIRTARDLIAELNQKLDDGEDAFAYAEQCASITKEQIEALYRNGGSHASEIVIIHAALSKKMTAMNVIARRRYSGEQAAIEWIRASAKSQVPLVRR